ncbi:MAG: RdgB/HAM1 family non-canonical purine NTP pyrophosphatase [Caldilineae bacterium]|nr:MAG: RdgB/HAM1 family non-canonical purine NTP pyrophosphatase [Caldilineae bacterium]
MKLLIATNNRHKLREYRQIFAGLPLNITSPAEEGLRLEPAETGATFAENAALKARAFARASGLLTLADDSGLEVDALGGEPGVFSARYGHTAKEDHAARYRLVLDKLAALGVPDAARTARFRCVIAIATPEGEVMLAEGTVEGRIAHAPAGTGGFGYDPIFWLPEYGCTMAQLDPAAKNAISHRGRAAQAAIPLLAKFTG